MSFNRISKLGEILCCFNEFCFKSLTNVCIVENLSRLTALQVLDIRGNSLSSLQDIQELSACTELESLFFRGVDGEDPNPSKMIGLVKTKNYHN